MGRFVGPIPFTRGKQLFQLGSKHTDVASFEDCSLYCEPDPACASFSYSARYSRCILYTTDGTSIDDVIELDFWEHFINHPSCPEVTASPSAVDQPANGETPEKQLDGYNGDDGGYADNGITSVNESGDGAANPCEDTATAYQCEQIIEAQYCYIQHFKEQCMESCGECLNSSTNPDAQPEEQPEGQSYGSDYAAASITISTSIGTTTTTTTTICYRLGQSCVQPMGTPEEEVVGCCGDTVCTPVYDAEGVSHPTCLLPATPPQEENPVLIKGDIAAVVVAETSRCSTMTSGQVCPSDGILMGLLDMSGETQKKTRCRKWCSTLSISASCCVLLRPEQGGAFCRAYGDTDAGATENAASNAGDTFAASCTAIDMSASFANQPVAGAADGSALVAGTAIPVAVVVAAFGVLVLTLVGVRTIRRRRDTARLESPFYIDEANTIYEGEAMPTDGKQQSLILSSDEGSPGSRNFASPYFDEVGQLLSSPRALPANGAGRSAPPSPLGRHSSSTFHISNPQPHPMDSSFVIEDPDAPADVYGQTQLISELEWRQRYYASPTPSMTASTPSKDDVGRGQRRRSSIGVGKGVVSSPTTAKKVPFDDSFVVDDGISGFEWRQRYYASPVKSVSDMSPFKSPVPLPPSHSVDSASTNEGVGFGLERFTKDSRLSSGSNSLLDRSASSSFAGTRSDAAGYAISPAPFFGGRKVKNPFYRQSPDHSAAGNNSAVPLGGLSPFYSPGANKRRQITTRKSSLSQFGTPATMSTLQVNESKNIEGALKTPTRREPKAGRAWRTPSSSSSTNTTRAWGTPSLDRTKESRIKARSPEPAAEIPRPHSSNLFANVKLFWSHRESSQEAPPRIPGAASPNLQVAPLSWDDGILSPRNTRGNSMN